jgi:hypothetical protein
MKMLIGEMSKLYIPEVQEGTDGGVDPSQLLAYGW